MHIPRFQDQVVLITGGNSGIGLATAKAFAQEGATLIITGRDRIKLAAASQEIGPDTVALQADVSQVAAIKMVMSQIQDRFGRLDVLFANAGISKFFPVEQTSESIFDDQVAINFKGVFLPFNKRSPHAGGWSHHSECLHRQPTGYPTKAAVRSLGRSFAAELAPARIRVNVVSPGTIQTTILNRAEGFEPIQADAVLNYYAETIPMKRIRQPEEMAQSVLFLASADASYIHGVELIVDGGFLEL